MWRSLGASDTCRGSRSGGTSAERVLVVGDDPDIVDFIEVTLAAAGYDVVVACDGRGALDKVDRLRPDLVLLDIMLPFEPEILLAHVRVRTALRRLREMHSVSPLTGRTARVSESVDVRG